MTTIYRTVYQVEVFNEDQPYDNDDLATIAYDITRGDFIGFVEQIDTEEVPPTELRSHLQRIGNDGSYFGDLCHHCGRKLAWGHVDYSDTPGWVHDDDGEPMCRPDDSDSPQAEAIHDGEAEA